MTFNQISNVLRVQPWVFASTMITFPHRYITRERWVNVDDCSFDDAVREIRLLGKQSLFLRRKYIYLHLNGFKFWTMGAPVEQTTIINMASSAYENAYADVAETYDQYFSDSSSRAEDNLLSYQLAELSGSSWLDIGCGTGLGARLSPGYVSSYIGVDSSYAMLSKFHASKAFATKLLINDYVENIHLDTYVDTIISLYGSISYVDAVGIKRIKEFLSPKGSVFLMAYNDTYTPVIHQKMQNPPKIIVNNHSLLQIFPNANVSAFGSQNQYLVVHWKKK